jgi:hypothetical protein
MQRMCGDCNTQLESILSELEQTTTISLNSTVLGDIKFESAVVISDNDEKASEIVELMDWVRLSVHKILISQMSVCLQRKYYFDAAVCFISAEHLYNEILTLV